MPAIVCCSQHLSHRIVNSELISFRRSGLLAMEELSRDIPSIGQTLQFFQHHLFYVTCCLWLSSFFFYPLKWEHLAKISIKYILLQLCFSSSIPKLFATKICTVLPWNLSKCYYYNNAWRINFFVRTGHLFFPVTSSSQSSWR